MEPLKQTWWQKISSKTHAFLRDDRGVKYFFIAIGVILVVGIGLLWLLQPVGGTEGTWLSFQEKEEERFYSPLTGVEVSDEATTQRPVTAIMMENTPPARPQSGLKDAGVVYEAVAEAGITRFIALYQEAQPELVGPVRSLRPYYLSWAAPYEASIAHVGGSARALEEVRNGEYRDIDQFFNADSYWRSDDRVAPYNVYTDFEHLNALNKELGYTTSEFTGFPRQPVDENGENDQEISDTAPLEDATNIRVNTSRGIFNSRYEYNAEENTYRRFQGDEPHDDREKGPITPKTVVVIKVPAHIKQEDGSRIQMDVHGSGDAYVFQDGKVIEGTWHKPGQFEQITFTDKNDEGIPFARGQTWITAMEPEREVSWE